MAASQFHSFIGTGTRYRSKHRPHSLSMLAGVDIGFDADGCVGAVNKVVHTHYLLNNSHTIHKTLTHRRTYNSTNLANRLDRLGCNS